MDIDMAAGNLPETLPLVHRPFEKIFAGLQRVPVIPVAQKFEGQHISDHPILSQNLGNAPARSSVRNVHENGWAVIVLIQAAHLMIEPCREAANRGDEK